ncbi:two-component system response regulator BtsR [Seleniivibrio sp.]|uniref:two-component system response regulator BtsR n=1 Tax=Seleniivibrio sp. TaxID=2898801 RepID=UPI0025E8E662|nr:two-component system response regulator BtsR [Seleniivibrio sp.]MCD8552721.1 two-component system response regulator BtsR [Seleniivibrio sp.]
MRYKALIIDDEPYAREELRFQLEKTKIFDIVGEAGNAVEGVKLVNKNHPDIIFLDINMPVINGFDMLSMIEKSIMPYVVFVTAYDQYALKAFEEKALDYLLKPVEQERLEKTLEKILLSLEKGEVPIYERQPLTKIPCALINTIKLIDMADIEYVYSDMTGVHAVTSDREYLTDLTLKLIECRSGLFRCHRQYLINLAKIDRIVLNENSSADAYTLSGRIVPVSRRYLKLLKDTLGL